MTILSHATGNGGPIDEAAVRQLQADVLTMRSDIADIKQSLVWLPAALDKLEHVVEQGDRIIEATAGPDGVPAWHATIGALGAVAQRLDAIEARLDTTAHQAQQTERMTALALALIGITKVGQLIAWWRRP